MVNRFDVSRPGKDGRKGLVEVECQQRSRGRRMRKRRFMRRMQSAHGKGHVARRGWRGDLLKLQEDAEEVHG